MSERYLVYFADPMCSWCYGFGPELEALLRDRPGLRMNVVMGGLRPYNTEKASPAFRETITGHWAHVARESGLTFSDAALAREGFVYDTEPACRAVVTVRATDPARALPYLKRVHAAFYAQGRDVTQPDVLADLAADQGLDRAAFLSAHAAPAAREAVRQDFAATQQTGVTGFPTLAVAYPGRGHYLVSAGFTRTAALVEQLDRIDEIAGEDSARQAS
ncbi:MAG TPA: DsbA family protein [Usitatibacteraceae bacterium]|nr:DsbA family protein [Usitatibacteraceae bacterium]